MPEWSIDWALAEIASGKQLREIAAQVNRCHQAIHLRIRKHAPRRYRIALRHGCIARIRNALSLPIDIAWPIVKRQQAFAARLAPSLLRSAFMRKALLTLYSRGCKEAASKGKPAPRKPKMLNGAVQLPQRTTAHNGKVQMQATDKQADYRATSHNVYSVK